MRQGRVEVGVAEQPLGIDLVVIAHRDVSVLGHWSTIVPSCKKSKYGIFWHCRSCNWNQRVHYRGVTPLGRGLRLLAHLCGRLKLTQSWHCLVHLLQLLAKRRYSTVLYLHFSISELGIQACFGLEATTPHAPAATDQANGQEATKCCCTSNCQGH